MIQGIGYPIIKTILLVALFVGLAGCTEPVSKFKVTKKTPSLKNFQHAVVSVQGKSIRINSQDGFRKSVKVMHEKISEAILHSGMFHTINGDPSGDSLLEVSIHILEFNYVSGPKRYLIWSLAGEAILGGNIQLIDKGSGKIIGKMSFTEKSGDQRAMLSDYTGKQINKITNLVYGLLTSS